jgi:2-polyprenyl-6-hydroxyphenyl methylase/3-demethylubiquinone-9 3-methyltransferase
LKRPIFNPDWPEDVVSLYNHDMQEIWDANITRQIWNLYHNQLDLYFSLTEGRDSLKILDVGCAQGTLALLLAERGHNVWAMDIRSKFLDYAASRYERGNVRFICGNAMEIQMEEKFDIIFANQIVEHLMHPLEFIRRLADWLTPGGHLVMTTPNGNYIRNSLPPFSELNDISQYEHLQFSADGDGHFFAYRGDELKQMYEEVGLKKVQITYFESPWISGHMKIRYLHSIVPISILRFLDRLTIKMPSVNKLLSHQIMIEGRLPT